MNKLFEMDPSRHPPVKTISKRGTTKNSSDGNLVASIPCTRSKLGHAPKVKQPHKPYSYETKVTPKTRRSAFTILHVRELARIREVGWYTFKIEMCRNGSPREDVDLMFCLHMMHRGILYTSPFTTTDRKEGGYSESKKKKNKTGKEKKRSPKLFRHRMGKIQTVTSLRLTSQS